MVVNRRFSVSTAPEISRTSSTQHASRVSKASTPPALGDKPEGTATKTSSKKKASIPSKRPRMKISYTGPIQLLLLALSAFVVYTVTVCRDNSSRKSAISKSLDFYCTNIIDPYITPSIETLVQHSGPYLEPYLEPLKPYATATTTFARIHVLPHASTLLDVTSKQYHAEVAPRLHWVLIEQFWNGLTKPLYFNILHPHLERHTRPHRFYYHKVLTPQVRKGAAYAHTTYLRIRPHVQHCLAKAQENAVGVYEAARPHALEAYQRIRPHAIAVLNQAQILALVLARKAGDIRREFVDPHLRKILDKVGENDASPPITLSESLTRSDLVFGFVEPLTGQVVPEAVVTTATT
ncbi:hypothetical protein H0H87_004407 [Tephrocybe sp. NHM501043]|nr:hypothetical protein H0H87_004407 [Tephrocybe sp. NHM501043]